MTGVAGAGRVSPVGEPGSAYEGHLQRKFVYLKARREGSTKEGLSTEREDLDRTTRIEKIQMLARDLFRELEEDETALSDLTAEVVDSFSLTDTASQIEVLTGIVNDLRAATQTRKESLEEKEDYCAEKQRQQERLIALHNEALATLQKLKKTSGEKYLNTPGLAERADRAGKWGASKASSS